MSDAPGVRVNLVGFTKFEKAVVDGANAGLRSRVLGDVFKQWAARYRGFAQERFDTYSKGGGNWAPLALSTIEGRRKGKRKNTIRSSLARDTAHGGRLVSAGGSFSILRDTGLLYAALTPEFRGLPGQLQEAIKGGVTVGFGGPGRHKGSTKATLAEIASYHQEGGGRLPKREIIVAPSEEIQQKMVDDLERGIRRLLTDFF